MNNRELSTLWIGAFRYYFGRMTYAVSDFCEILCKSWSDLPEEVKRSISLEIDDAFINNKNIGMECDRDEWQKVRNIYSK